MLHFFLFSQFIRWRLIEPIKRFFVQLPPPPPSPPSLHTFTQHTLVEERIDVSNGRYSFEKIGEVLREGGQTVKKKRFGSLFKFFTSRLDHRLIIQLTFDSCEVLGMKLSDLIFRCGVYIAWKTQRIIQVHHLKGHSRGVFLQNLNSSIEFIFLHRTCIFSAINFWFFFIAWTLQVVYLVWCSSVKFFWNPFCSVTLKCFGFFGTGKFLSLQSSAAC